MIVISYGVGTDSTALLVEAHRRCIRPDLIVWADTGSEHPRTYAYLTVIRDWLASVGFPDLTVTRWIRRDGSHTPLHEVCEDRKELPSAAYGYAGCSSKWKRQPIDRLIDTHPDVIAALQHGEVVERWVGYSVDEEHRIGRLPTDGPYRWRAPLAEWDIDRADARQAIICAGLPLPGKSACWLCPHTRPAEVRALRAEHPDLYQRAVAIEAGANLESVKGLGRSWSWADLEDQAQMFPVRLADLEGDDLPCACTQ